MKREGMRRQMQRERDGNEDHVCWRICGKKKQNVRTEKINIEIYTQRKMCLYLFLVKYMRCYAVAIFIFISA